MDIKDRTDEAIQITYMNHRGKIADRRIIPIKLWFGKTEWYPEPQWFMKAWDRDKEAERDFAVKRIVCPKVADHNEQTKRIAELEDAGRILAFLDAIETTEIITADGCDRDVDPDGFGFSGEMLKLMEAIAADENDVWNTAARCAWLEQRPSKEIDAMVAIPEEPNDPMPLELRAIRCRQAIMRKLESSGELDAEQMDAEIVLALVGATEEWASQLKKTLAQLESNSKVFDEADARLKALKEDSDKVLAELEDLRDNHLPKVGDALQRANKMGAEADHIIMDMAEHLRLAIQAIEGGEHHGNGSYTQRFGQAFLERLRKSQEQIKVVPPEHRASRESKG